jgi:uncharacterized membrane protein YhaH (DUF805 family)
MNWGHILFSFNGRINRAKWWLAVLVMIILSVLAAILGAIIGSEGASNALAFIAWLITLWISLAAGAKRLHDLNRSAAWLVVFVGAPILLIIIFFGIAGMSVGAALISGQELDPAELARIGGVGLIIGVLYLAVVVWALIWFGCLRGTVGPNQYGPDPLEGRI